MSRSSRVTRRAVLLGTLAGALASCATAAVQPTPSTLPTPTPMPEPTSAPTPSSQTSSPIATPPASADKTVPVPPGSKIEADPAKLSSQFIEANMNFGWNLLKQTAKGSSENVFLSPANVSIALAMTANGAKGDTFAAMSKLVAAPNITLDQLNADYAALQTLLKRSDDKVSVSLANALWAKQGVPFDPAFIARAHDVFGARISELDFNSADAPATINQWVRDSTKGKINGIVDKIDPATILLLTSAIHFKGVWAKPFDKASTADLPFHLLDGKQKQVPMMLRVGQMRYLKTAVGQAVQLSYAGDALRMVVLLSDETIGADAALDKLNAQQWRAWQGAFAAKHGTLYLPRFKAESDLSLKDALGQLGMGIAFDDQKADFSGIRPVPPQLVITSVRHKSFVEVNEEGTEAAAATSIGVGVTSARPIEDTFEMTVDRPFIIAIEDVATGALLFAGVIRQPN